MDGIISVLCISDYFSPGFLGGGPITTLCHMRKQLLGHVSFSIFTRDRDLGAKTQYPGIETNRWLDTPQGSIYYATPDNFGIQGLRWVLRTRNFDVIYLNSYFSPYASIIPYIFIRRSTPKRRILLAPRGEFSPGALAIKKCKKLFFLKLVRILGLYRDVFWHASSLIENRDILRQFPEAAGRIHVAPDPVSLESSGTTPLSVTRDVGKLRIAFISRISPMKNLDGLIDMLAGVSVRVTHDIFGPIEDDAYWRLCKQRIAALPDNIQVRFHGAIAPEAVSRTFANYDLFAFPTHGENFGHVIFEALRAGTPVLISDQTPWQPDKGGAITVISLDDSNGWRSAIESAANRTSEEQERVRSASLEYAKRYACEKSSFRENLEMFRKISIS